MRVIQDENLQIGIRLQILLEIQVFRTFHDFALYLELTLLLPLFVQTTGKIVDI